jgi:hypothetical protein
MILYANELWNDQRKTDSIDGNWTPGSPGAEQNERAARTKAYGSVQLAQITNSTATAVEQ